MSYARIFYFLCTLEQTLRESTAAFHPLTHTRTHTRTHTPLLYSDFCFTFSNLKNKIQSCSTEIQNIIYDVTNICACVWRKVSVGVGGGAVRRPPGQDPAAGCLCFFCKYAHTQLNIVLKRLNVRSRSVRSLLKVHTWQRSPLGVDSFTTHLTLCLSIQSVFYGDCIDDVSVPYPLVKRADTDSWSQLEMHIPLWAWFPGEWCRSLRVGRGESWLHFRPFHHFQHVSGLWGWNCCFYLNV